MGLFRYKFSKIPIIISCYLIVGFSSLLYAQPDNNSHKINSSALLNFAKTNGSIYQEQRIKVDSLSREYNIPLRFTDSTGRIVTFQYVDRNGRPVFYATDNSTAAKLIFVDQLWDNAYGGIGLSGDGEEVNIWDGGSILDIHQEFQNGIAPRIEMRDRNIDLSNHSTHIAGTIGASGVEDSARGMAGEVKMYGWDLDDDLTEVALAVEAGARLSNHSYGPLCGWYYNALYEAWFWNGDIMVSDNEDYQFGLYNQISSNLDFITYSAPEYLLVKSAGNDRGDAPPIQPVYHYIWDGSFKLSNEIRDPDGGINGYDCLSPMSVAKNILTVGAVDDSGIIAPFSAVGPTDDGRIKPDLVTNGVSIYSPIASSIDSYGYYNGTSMACASATGAIAILYQLQEKLQPGIKLLSSTSKGILIHTAKERVINQGPDYNYGWGLMDIKSAADLLYANYANGGENIIEGVYTGTTQNFELYSDSSSPYLKITLCWTDPPGESSEQILNSRTKKLVNDLNIEITNIATAEKCLPWILDVENPDAPASRGLNHTDNVEQLVVPNPGDEHFNLIISHSGELTGNEQAFSLIITGITYSENIYPPRSLRCKIDEPGIHLFWSPPDSALPETYHVYKNDALLMSTSDTNIYDANLLYNENNEYFIKANYKSNDIEKESISSNHITIHPEVPEYLPFHEDFEAGDLNIKIKNSEEGWLYGNSETLSNYYLKFQENTTNFIGIDSYSSGETSHIYDIAVTPPFKLQEYRNVILSFNYFLLTGTYDAIDELHVVYKLQEADEWQEWVSLPRSVWTSKALDLPEDAYQNGVQIGFYYDDFYQWGMGAAIDNIKLNGSYERSVDLSLDSMIFPVSACYLNSSGAIRVLIQNLGPGMVLPGDSIEIEVDIEGVRKLDELIILQDTIPVNQTFEYEFTQGVDLPIADTYNFNFIITFSRDPELVNNSLQDNVDVYENPLPEILVQDSVYCFDDPPIPILLDPVGGTLDGEGLDGTNFNPQLAGPGIHQLDYTYIDENGCSGSTSINFLVNSLPVPVILNTDSVFCSDDSSVLINTNPSGGTLSGEGLIDTRFYPNLAGTGIHQLDYTFIDENTCSGSTSINFLVNPLPDPLILNTDSVFCSDDSSVLIITNPPGGTLSGDGLIDTRFYPNLAGTGIHQLDYTFIDENTCSGSTSINFLVNPLPDPLILNTDNLLFLDENPIQILVSPPGGIISGPGIDGNTFDPILAGEGTHIIYYELIEKSCTAITGFEITVISRVHPEILIGDTTLCINDEVIQMEVFPEGGLLSGEGISGLLFFPGEAGPGNHTITYSCSSIVNCNGKDSIVITVLPAPEAKILNPDLYMCISDTPVLIETDPPGGLLSGPGVINNSIYPALAGQGLHTITYLFSNAYSCQSFDQTEIRIYDSPTIDLGPNLYSDLNDTVVIYASGNADYYYWFDGTIGDSIEIITSEIGSGVHPIWIIAKNSESCSASDTIILSVNTNDLIERQSYENLKIFPNPFDSGFYIECNGSPDISEFCLYSFNGRIIMNSIPTTFPYIDLNTFPSGSYYLKITIESATYMIKLVKI